MKRKAFTLVELMVVMSILALLVAILLPSMSSVFALARQTICKGNLKRLGDAFSTASGGSVGKTGRSSSVREIVSSFPRPLAWPEYPQHVVSDPTVYKCPEAPVKQGQGALRDMLALCEYVCPYGSFPMDTMEGKSQFYISRRGEDPERGKYTEYMLQDDNGNGQFELMDFHKWVDTDGACRVYDDGTIYVFEDVPTTPDWEGCRGPGYPDRMNTCPDINIIHFRGEPAFGNEGRLRNHRGQYHKLKDWKFSGAGMTNYGINSYAEHYPYGTDCIVLVDYNELIVEVDEPLEAGQILQESARHLGRVNYLTADGRVKSTWPIDITPADSPKNDPLWNPEDVVRPATR